MITIKQIARELGLSTTTVSNVIHGKTGEVSPETIDRVTKFLDKVEYVPNISARNLAQNHSRIIGIVLKSQESRYINLLTDPFVSELIAGIESGVREKGYFMMVYMSDDINEILSQVSTWNVDGLLLYCMMDDDGKRVLEKYHKPVVFIDTYPGKELKRYVNIGLDDEKGSHDITEYLIRNGHRKIAFLSDNDINVDHQRFLGYKRALKEAGIEYRDENFLLLNSRKEELERSWRELAGRATGFSAVVCCSDLFAIQLMDALNDAGIRVPDDVSVVGFDDNLYGRLHRPALTTVHQDVEERGKLAAEVLIDMISGKEPENSRVVMEPSLVLRDTVKKLNG